MKHISHYMGETMNKLEQLDHASNALAKTRKKLHRQRQAVAATEWEIEALENELKRLEKEAKK